MSKSIQTDLQRVGLGYSVRWILHENMTTECVWHPRQPVCRDARRILKAGVYRRVRDQFISDVARELGVSVMCLELAP
jgi:hypothetical protein